MRIILSGIGTIVCRLGLIPTLAIMIAMPLIINLLIAISGQIALTANADIGFKLVKISDTIITFLLNPIIYAPIKLFIMGSAILLAWIILVSIFSPTFFDRKIMEDNSRKYVLYKLKGEHEIAEKLEKKIAELILRQTKNRVRYF